MTLRDWLACRDPELILLDGEEFDAAIVGVVSGSGMEDRVLYSQDGVLQVLRDHHGMDHLEAVEWFDHNIGYAFVGDKSPAFLEKPDL